MRVEVFSLGFGPRLAGFVWRGTDFRLSAVPFGGFVMVAGQDPSDRRFPDRVSLHSKSVAQRALFWSGGVVMNVLFALIVFPIVFGAGVRFEAPIAGPVPVGSAAWEVGIERGERILEVAGKRIYSWQNLQMEVALNGNRPVELLVEADDGSRRLVVARPHYSRAAGMYELGIEPAYDASTATLAVDAEGPAAAAGLRTGDEIVAIAGRAYEVGQTFDGEPLVVRVRRDGVEHEATVVAGTKQLSPMIGVSPLLTRIAGIRAGSALVERLGLQRDDQLLAIDGKPFLSGDLQVAATGPDETVWLVLRDGKPITLRQPATADERAALAQHVALSGDRRLQLQPAEDGAAAAAGLLAGDWLRAIDDVEIEDWDHLRSVVLAAEENPLRVRVLRPDPARVVDGLDKPTGREIELTIAPRGRPAPDYGLAPQVARRTVEIRANSFGEALQLGTVCSIDLIKQLYVTLKRLITGEVGAKNLGGIIRISQVSYHAAQRGPSWFWWFLSLLSLNLAFVNLLPVPVLDGGHLMFLLIEKVKGSPVSTRVFGYSQVIGLVFVLLLVLFVTYNDIRRLF